VAGALGPVELRMLMLGTFAFTMAMGGMQSNFAVLTLKRFQYGPDDNAVLFAYLGLMAAIGQGLLVRWVVPHTGEVHAARIGLGLDVLGFAAIAYAPSPFWIYVSLTLTAMGNGLLGPTLTSLIAQRAKPGEQGQVLGANQAISSLGRIVGPLVAGWTFDHISTGAPYWLGAASLAMGLFFLRNEERYTAPHV
jgi:MFS family permease